MAQQINVNITANGQPIKIFSTLTISQQFNGHHYFELRFNHDVFEDADAMLINKSKDFLGAQLSITMSSKEDSGYPDHVFKGVITEISVINNVNTARDLVFKGYSPTVLMDGGEHNATYSNKTLGQVVKGALSGIPGNVLSTAVNPVIKTSSIPFVMQYRESNFDFVRRLAAEYGEWFFYDGSTFNFGKPSSTQSIDLKYPRDIVNMDLKVKIVPANFEQTGYFSKDDKKFNSPAASQTPSGLDSFGTHALNKSNSLYAKPTNLLSYKPVQNKNELDDLVSAQKAEQAAKLVYINASSDSPYVKLGTTVAITAMKSDRSDEDYGKFMITSVVHSTDGLGNYTNYFEGIPSSLKIVPNPYSIKPSAEPQLGIVKNNDDPDHLGKVKVQLLWQKDNETTPFIRVMTPHSGTRNDDKKNRGTFFTPEVGDYVIVGFHQDDPDRPFVMGSVPSGKAINTSMNSDNDAKAIRTRSGNTIYFYDKESNNQQEIKIETDEKNYVSILLDNKKGTIKIYTNDKIEIKSDNEISLTSKDIKITASNDITMKANNNINIEASNNISIKAQMNAELKAMKINAEATQEFEAKGMQVAIEGSLQASVKGGAELELNGGAMATLKGAMVMIN